MIWEWLEYSIEEGHSPFLADEEKGHWLGDTLYTAHTIVLDGSNYQLDAHQLVEDYTGLSPLYVYTPSGKRWSGKEAYTHILHCALCKWYSFSLGPPQSPG